MNNGKIIATSESHKKVFNVYSELKKMLPFGYLKTKISPSPKYEIPYQPIIKHLENEKNLSIETSPSLKTQHLLYNKNIYLYSDSSNGKKIISRLKQFHKNSNKTAFSHSKTVKKIKNEDIDRDIFDNELVNENINNGYDFKSFSINNFNMKANIFLPSIKKRMKNNLPRNMRQKKGLSVKGIGIKSLKLLLNNNKTPFNAKIFRDDETKAESQYTRSDIEKYIYPNKTHDLKLGLKMGDIKYVSNFYKFRKNTNKKSKKVIKEKNDDSVEIVGLKLVKKNINNVSISSNN